MASSVELEIKEHAVELFSSVQTYTKADVNTQ